MYSHIDIFISFIVKSRRRLRRPANNSTQTDKTNAVGNLNLAEKRIDQDTAATTTISRSQHIRTKAKLRNNNSTAVGVLVASGSTLKEQISKLNNDGKKIVCYYTNWSQYRSKIGKFVPEDIPADLCTHIIFAFGWLKKGKLSSYETNDETKDNVPGLYDRIMLLKRANPKLQVKLQ